MNMLRRVGGPRCAQPNRSVCGAVCMVLLALHLQFTLGTG